MGTGIFQPPIGPNNNNNNKSANDFHNEKPNTLVTTIFSNFNNF